MEVNILSLGIYTNYSKNYVTGPKNKDQESVGFRGIYMEVLILKVWLKLSSN